MIAESKSPPEIVFPDTAKETKLLAYDYDEGNNPEVLIREFEFNSQMWQEVSSGGKPVFYQVDINKDGFIDSQYITGFSPTVPIWFQVKPEHPAKFIGIEKIFGKGLKGIDRIFLKKPIFRK